MVSNDIVMPMLIRSRWINIQKRPDLSQLILVIRRITIILILLSSYGYFRLSGNNQQLANMGLLSFAATIQFAPAMIAALYWQRANQRGVLIGLAAGASIWAYCLLMPNFIQENTLNAIFSNFTWLHPHHLFSIEFSSSLTHGVFWSLLFNVAGMIIGSLRYAPTVLDKIQASIFTHTLVEQSNLSDGPHFAVNATVANAKVLCESIIGSGHTEQLFEQQNSTRNSLLADDEKIDKALIVAIERAIAGVIGASSAQHIITTQLLGEDVTAEDLFVMMDETTQALQFNQDILQASFENISQGISVVDKNLNLVAWNTRYKDMFDYPDALMKIGTPIEALIRHNAARGDCGEGDINQQVSRRLNHLRTGQTYTSQRQRRGAYIKINGNPIPGGGFVTSFTDITEQKNIELALRNSESRIRLYTDNLPLMLSYIGQDEKVHFSNKAYNQFVGKASNEMKNVPINSLFKDQHFIDRKNYIKRALSGEVVQFRCSPEADKNTYYQINYIPQIQQDGNVDGFFAIYQDITQSVEAAELLTKTNELLEVRVTERTQDLERLNQKLQTENTTTLKLSEELKSVTKSKTRFLAAASHDLLQPINAARLFTHSLIDQPEPHIERDHNLLQKIDSSLVNADKLLRALLDISKLDTGTITPDIQPFYIDELLQDLITELSPLAERKGIEINFLPCHILVSSDKTLLRSIIQNLITNAIRYTQQGKILIGCRRRPNSLSIQVLDTGTGIAEPDLSLIFNEFHRIANAADKDQQGLGLGLAITQRLAEILGHPLKVASVLGQGSQFSLCVPRYFGEVKSTPKSKTWMPASNLKGITVLYLENAPDSLDAMAALLNNWGCKVITCQHYPEAVTALNKQQQQIDMILADYRLDEPETGLDFLNYATQVNQHITGVLVTAEQDRAIKNQTLENGHVFLAKPVEPAALRGILTRLASMRVVS